MGINRRILSAVVGQGTVRSAGYESADEEDYVFLAEVLIAELGRDGLRKWLRWRRFNKEEKALLYSKFIEKRTDTELCELLGMQLGELWHFTDKTSEKFVKLEIKGK